MSSQLVSTLETKISKNSPLDAGDGLAILQASDAEFVELLNLADRVRRANFGNRVELCSIVNAKSGVCSEDCAFCSQSVHHDTDVEAYELLPEQQLEAAYREASDLPISHFGFVTSGPGLDSEEFDRLVELLENSDSEAAAFCSSLGNLGESQLRRLREAGLKRFHHNLETARSYFDQICSTHDYEQRVETVKSARKVGLEVCSGGLLGLGESLEQRVEFALDLRELEVDSIPLNFLIPIEGTELETVRPLTPREMLRSIIMFRLINPTTNLKVCAGRKNLRDLQSLIFFAGATGMMIGDLLTVAGRSVETDLRMLDDLNLDYE